MRPIDADALKKNAYMEGGAQSIAERVVTVSDIDDAPTVEAVPIKWLYEQSDNPNRSDRFRNACDLVAMTWLEERKEE